MAKRPSIGKYVDLHDEFVAHGDDIPEAAVRMRSSSPPPARISRPPQPSATIAADTPEPPAQEGGF